MKVNYITNCIADVLKNHYSDIRIYKDKARQNLTLPYFFIQPINIITTPSLKGRLHNKYTYKITFTTDDIDDKYEFLENVFFNFKYINNDIKINTIKANINGDNIDVYIKFNIYYNKEIQYNTMKVLKESVFYNDWEKVHKRRNFE